MSYIKRKTAISYIKRYVPHVGGSTTMKCVIRALNQVPTVDIITPCDACVYGVPSSGDGKPCIVCPAREKNLE